MPVRTPIKFNIDVSDTYRKREIQLIPGPSGPAGPAGSNAWEEITGKPTEFPIESAQRDELEFFAIAAGI